MTVLLWSMLPVAGDRPRRCRVITPVVAPCNSGRLYPADPPTVEEIIALLRRTLDVLADVRRRCGGAGHVRIVASR